MSRMPDNFEDAKAWAEARVGKVVYRPRLSDCQCNYCKGIANGNLVIDDEYHAAYLTDCAMEMGYRYQDEPINEGGQVEAGSDVQALLREGMLAGGPNPQPSYVDTDQPSERASDGGTVPALPPTN